MVGTMSKDDDALALEQVRRLHQLWCSGNLSSEDLIFQIGDILDAQESAAPSTDSTESIRPKLRSPGA
jgi:hypothetical protein